MSKWKWLKVLATILGAIGLGESNFIVNFLSWEHQDFNWIDIQFSFKWFTGDIHVVWQVSLINCIIIFWSFLWVSWIAFLVSSWKPKKRKKRRKTYAG